MLRVKATLRDYKRHNATMREVGIEWGISKQGVDQLERATIRRLWRMGLPRYQHLKEQAIKNFIMRRHDEQQLGLNQ